MHSFKSNGASLGDPESQSTGLMSGIMESRRSTNSSNSRSSEESSTGMSSRDSTMDILEDSFEEDFHDGRNLISGRGQMIRGALIPQQEAQEMEPPSHALRNNTKDVEAGAARAPDSDYAPDFPTPSTLCPSDEFQGRIQGEVGSPIWLFPTSTKEPSATSRSSGSQNAAPTKKNFERFSDDVLSNSSSDHGRRKRWWYILGAASMVLLAAVIAVAVLVSGSGGDLTSQQQQLSEISKSLSSESDLQDTNSPQAKAYQWLVYDDILYKDAKSIPKEWAAQRYVLAVFYYATMGPYKWELGTNWLQGSECLDEWLGIACNDQGFVRTLAFGKSHRTCTIAMKQ